MGYIDGNLEQEIRNAISSGTDLSKLPEWFRERLGEPDFYREYDKDEMGEL